MRRCHMEEIRKLRLIQFVHDICIFSGLLLWGALFLVIFGGYQVGWKQADSINETVINQVNQEKLVEKTYAEQESRSRKK